MKCATQAIRKKLFLWADFCILLLTFVEERSQRSRSVWGSGGKDQRGHFVCLLFRKGIPKIINGAAKFTKAGNQF